MKPQLPKEETATPTIAIDVFVTIMLFTSIARLTFEV